MATFWKLNEQRRRFELVEVDDATGRVRVLEAFIDPSTDNTDLRGVPVDTLPAEVLAQLAPAAQGNTDARNQVNIFWTALTRQSIEAHGQGRTFALIAPQQRSTGGGGQAGGQTGVRMEPEDIAAQTNRFLAALDVQGAANVLTQKEWELRQKMLAEGFDPNEFFGADTQGGGSGGASGQSGLPGVPGAPQTTTTGAMLPASYVNAYTDQEKAAASAALQARAQRLQEVSNRFAMRSAGAKNLSAIGSLRQQIEELEAELNTSESQLSANPANDKHLVAGPDGNWYHSQNTGAARALRDLKRQYREAQDAMDPKAAVERRRQEGRQQNWRSLPQGVRVRQWGEKGYADTAPEDVDSEQARLLAGIYSYTKDDAYLPAYASGGSYLPQAPGNVPVTQSPYAPSPPQFPAPPMLDSEQMAKLKAAQDEQTGKEAVFAERIVRARAQSEQRKAQAQVTFAQEMARIQQERSELQTMRGMTGLNGAGQPAYAGG